MRLILVNFNNVLGLNGYLNFVEGKPLLIYGENRAGKSNIINMLRYCLIPKLGKKKGYAEEKRLKKNEILLKKNATGSVEIYFQQGKKLYKLYYFFSRKGKNVRQVQKLFESELIELPIKDDERIKALQDIEWKDLAVSSSRALKKKFEEIKIYPEILDILISPSNVRAFSEAIGGKVVKVPEIIATKISNLHENTRKYLKNLKELHGVIILERNEIRKRIKEFEEEFEQTTKDLPEINPKEIFTTGEIVINLELLRKTLSEKLELMPEKVTKMREILTIFSSEKYEIWASALNNIVTVLTKKEELKNIIEKERFLKGMEETLITWKTAFQQLPPDSAPEALLFFTPPEYKKFDFGVLSKPERIKSMFSSVSEAKNSIQKAIEICKKYKILPKTSEINKIIGAYKKLFKALKNPLEPKGDPALISKQEDKVVVSIPLNVALKNIEYLRGIEPTPLIHRPKKLGKEKFKEEVSHLQKEIGTILSDLRNAKTNLSKAKKMLKRTKQLRIELEGEERVLKKNVENLKKRSDKLMDQIKKAYHHLCEVFKLKYEEIDMSTRNAVDASFNIMSIKYEEAQKIFSQDLTRQLKEYPEILEKFEISKKEAPIDIMKKLREELDKKIKEITALQQEYRKVNNWILENIAQLRSIENRSKTVDIINVAVFIALEILTRIHMKTDIKKIIGELAGKIEEYVEEAYNKICPEGEMFDFKHIGEGQFLPTINNEPITHPSGAERVAISVGILLSLAETFRIPVILDEAFDRLAVKSNVANSRDRLKFFCEYISGLTGSTGGYQICLAGYTTFNIEKNPEVLSFVNRWKIYLLEMINVLEKNIKPLKEFSVIE